MQTACHIWYTVLRVLEAIVTLARGAGLAWGVVDATGSGFRSVGRTLLHFNADETRLEDHLLRVDVRDVEFRGRAFAVEELERLGDSGTVPSSFQGQSPLRSNITSALSAVHGLLQQRMIIEFSPPSTKAQLTKRSRFRLRSPDCLKSSPIRRLPCQGHRRPSSLHRGFARMPRAYRLMRRAGDP